jgi:hypothetical protein
MADQDTNPTRPAFPCEESHGDGVQQITRHLGLSAREYAAIEMAKAIIAGSGDGAGNVEYDEATVATNAIAMADSLLAKLAGG